MNIRKSLINILLVMVLALLTSGISYAVSPEQQATICAEENIENYLGMIEGCAIDFHFQSEADLEKAYLGNPIPHISLGVSEFDPSQPIKKQAEQSGFYHFPVLVDDKIVTDFTIGLENGIWKPIDIGGHLCKKIVDVTAVNNLAIEDAAILNFAGELCVIIDHSGEEYAFLPYSSSYGLEKDTLLPGETFKKQVLEERLNLVKEQESDEGISGGSLNSSSPSLEQEGLGRRMAKYIKYIF